MPDKAQLRAAAIRMLRHLDPEAARQFERNPAQDAAAVMREYFRGEQGITGKDGYTPKAGTDYPTPEQVRSYIESLVTAMMPIKGVHYHDGAPGKDADQAAIIREILKLIPIPKDGRDGLNGKPGKAGRDGQDGISPSITAVIAAVIDYIKKEQPIDITHIRNWQSFRFPTRTGKGMTIKTEEMLHGAPAPAQTTTLEKFVTTGGPQDVTLTHTPLLILSVVVNGQVLSDDAGDYSVVGATISLLNGATPAGLYGTITYTYA